MLLVLTVTEHTPGTSFMGSITRRFRRVVSAGTSETIEEDRVGPIGSLLVVGSPQCVFR